MPRLDYQTAGESHGPALIAIVTGLPAGVELDEAFINGEMTRRQGGYGRGAERVGSLQRQLPVDVLMAASNPRPGLSAI